MSTLQSMFGAAPGHEDEGEGEGEGEGDGAVECAICFERVAVALALPCACRVDYCARCWDRSLAASFRSSGQARCPTCRTAIRVDFDATAERLVFSREGHPLPNAEEWEARLVTQVHDAAPGAAGRHLAAGGAARARAHQDALELIDAASSAAIERIARQAVPAQVSSLARYGGARQGLLEMAQGHAPCAGIAALPVRELRRHIQELGGNDADCTEKGDLLERLCTSAGSWSALASYWAAAAPDAQAPLCVCGSALKRTTGLDRLTLFLRESLLPNEPTSSARFQRALRDYTMLGGGCITCDVCEEPVTTSGVVWSCAAGSETILHANSYDVCDECFQRHAFGADEAGDSSSSSEPPPPPRRSSSSSSPSSEA